VKSKNLPYRQEGRNSYPDFWVGNDKCFPVEGYEVKALAFARGKASRKDYDSNSTIPSGRKNHRDVFLVFFLYTGSKESLRKVHSLSIAHTDVINSDHELAESHANESIHGFGSYGDGFIRNRKMYVFPHPFAIDPQGVGRCRLIVPSEWRVRDERLDFVGSIERTAADRLVDHYSIHLYQQKKAQITRSPNPEAGAIRRFDIFEAKEL